MSAAVYEWMGAARGNAHFCKRTDQASAPVPVCGAEVKGMVLTPAGAQSKCTKCLKAEGDILKYRLAMGKKV